MKRIGFLAVILILFLAQVSCLPGTEERIAQVLNSPDGKVQAVRMNREAGATVSDSVFIYIVPKGDSVGWGNAPSVRVNRYSDVSMQWGGENTLNVTYQEANIIELNRTWSSPKVNNSHYQVKLTLQQKP